MSNVKKIKVNNDGSHEIEYYDTGGQVQPSVNGNGTTQVAGPSQADISGGINSVANPTQSIPALFNPAQSAGNAINLAGGISKSFANAFTQQNGYQANLAPTQTNDYSGLIGQAGNQALQGYGNYQNIAQQQQQLANALRAQANGAGPNPAQAALNQQTGINVANQAALMAGQRGSSANPALLARLAAQQGANTQQQAVGQGATLQAQQQLAAQSALQAQQAQQAQGAIAEQNANTGLFNAGAGAQNAQNNTSVNNYSMAQGINSQVAQNNANAVNKTLGGGLGAAGSILGSLFNKGGEVGRDGENPKLAQVSPKNRFAGAMAPHIKHLSKIYHPQMYDDGGQIQVPNLMTPTDSDKDKGSGLGSLVGLAALLNKGGKVDVMLSPGERYIPPSKVGQVAKGKESALEVGKKVPGKAKVSGDSEKNDTFHTRAEVGGIVIPRSIMQSKNPGQAAKAFVEKEMASHGSPKDHAQFKDALKKAIKSRREK